MPDREKVITDLQIIHTWAAFAMERHINFFNEKHMKSMMEWTNDAITLLKTQEAEWLEVDDEHDAFDCSQCGAMVKRKCLYCPGCGAKMKNGSRAIEVEMRTVKSKLPKNHINSVDRREVDYK